MDIAVYLPLLLSAAFGLIAPAVARRLPPAVATWLLSLGGLVAAGACGAALFLLAFTLIGQDPLVAAQGHWSGSALRHADPVATPVAILSLTALSVCAARMALAVLSFVWVMRDAYSLAASLPAPGGELAVLDVEDAIACAVPGRPGRVVVSTGLLRALDARQRRALLAHERAHLTHRHHLHRMAAGLAAAANPLLGRLPSASALSTERWADEVAAAGSRRDVVASAVAHAAKHQVNSLHARTSVVLALGAEHVTDRIRALQTPVPRVRVWPILLAGGLLGVAVLATLDAAHDAERLFEFAQYVYRLRHR